MATTTVVRHVPLAPERAAALVADFTTSQTWDPGVVRARRVDALPDLEVGARYEVGFRAGPVTMPLVYELTTYVPGTRVVLETRGSLHHGRDDVRFARTGDGATEVTWEATFGFNGVGRLIDPLLGVGFRRVAAKAGDGLAAFLTGAATEEPA